MGRFLCDRPCISSLILRYTYYVKPSIGGPICSSPSVLSDWHIATRNYCADEGIGKICITQGRNSEESR